MTQELKDRAAPLLACDHRANRPNPRVPGERIVGFVIGEDEIGHGLSEPLAALDAVVALAKRAEQLEAEIARLREGLATRDKAVATCPIQRRYQDVCPKCKATSSEDCGVVSAADYQFVEAARALLKGQGK